MGHKNRSRTRRNTSRLGALCLNTSGVVVVLIGVGNGAAAADIVEVGPGPTVTSRQASEFAIIRSNDFGVARAISEARVGEAGMVSAHGEVRHSTKAVVGSAAAPFESRYPICPGVGDW